VARPDTSCRTRSLQFATSACRHGTLHQDRERFRDEILPGLEIADYDFLECHPRATFVVLDGAGHNLQIEQDSLFAALVREWLRRVEGLGPREPLPAPVGGTIEPPRG
jgi:hypothetical protein